MTELENRILAEAQRLLSENLADVVIAFKQADTPLRPQPAFFTNAEAVNDLVYNGLCQNNLANYLTRYPREKKIAMVVRGCESRSVNALVLENQHPRENLYLIGIPCEGIVDWRKIVEAVGEDVLSVQDQADIVVVRTPKGEFTLDRAALMHGSCLRCTQKNPLGTDVTIGKPVAEQDPHLLRERVKNFEALGIQTRYEYFRQESERCIRCYACREACPMCYCEECFVDHTGPRWTESGVTPAGMQGWHIIRAFHQTGRCTSCGACERACPMDIHMTYLTDKLNTDMYDKYQFVAGLDAKTQTPFAAFNLDDKNRFVAGGTSK